ncbi:MAG: hypothetical protein SF162_20385 [bacterium]|nr:hypothetical protein [bacterium]
MGEFLLFSAQTKFVYDICKAYFNGLFYVYCSPEFDSEVNPGSSNPATLIAQFRLAVQRNDRGDTKIKDIKKKLRAAALRKKNRREITPETLREVQVRINRAEVRDFLPYLYLIPKDNVRGMLIPVPYAKRASPDSDEYTIEGLQASQFEFITSKFGNGLP